ncbi:MAG: hypothetical protein QME81_18555 [bacterium]|nr:hypothetical protein [bacterium]
MVSPLNKVIAGRVSLDLFESDALDEIIKSSGGVLRELCKNVQHCCLLSMQKVERINVAIVKKMLANLCNQFTRQVPPNTYPKYRQINQTKWIEEEERARLLSSLNVLEYINDELWYDLHPILKIIISKTGVTIDV